MEAPSERRSARLTPLQKKKREETKEKVQKLGEAEVLRGDMKVEDLELTQRDETELAQLEFESFSLLIDLSQDEAA
jgi:hypothetical protein